MYVPLGCLLTAAKSWFAGISACRRKNKVMRNIIMFFVELMGTHYVCCGGTWYGGNRYQLENVRTTRFLAYQALSKTMNANSEGGVDLSLSPN